MNKIKCTLSNASGKWNIYQKDIKDIPETSKVNPHSFENCIHTAVVEVYPGDIRKALDLRNELKFLSEKVDSYMRYLITKSQDGK